MLSPKESRKLALKIKAYGNPDKDLLFKRNMPKEEKTL